MAHASAVNMEVLGSSLCLILKLIRGIKIAAPT